ncbi:DUF4276 family protein [soil metagenome]|nr:hypothetical protein [Gemmatimonadota bacterium]
MHIEVLVEDSSGEKLLGILLPQFLGAYAEPHTWRLRSYKGIGRIPPGLKTTADPAKRILLEQLPKLLRGYGKTPGIDAVAIVLDSDSRDCVTFLQELKALAESCDPRPHAMFRLAIEEMEAWYFGDRHALTTAYPRARAQILDGYVQDKVCGTWERLADAVHKGGSAAVKKAGWPAAGDVKHEWAQRIGPLMDVERNLSPSFGKLRDGFRRLIAEAGTT